MRATINEYSDGTTEINIRAENAEESRSLIKAALIGKQPTATLYTNVSQSVQMDIRIERNTRKSSCIVVGGRTQ